MRLGKKVFCFLFALFIFLISMLNCAPLKNVPIKMVQPDGTVLKLFLSGDEYYNWVHDKDNFTIVKDPVSQYLVYAVIKGGKLVPSQYVVGTVNPNSVGLVQNLNVVPYNTNLKKKIQYEEAAINAAGPALGKRYNLVIFIRFNDEPEFSSPISKYDELLNSPDARSLKDFYSKESNNKLEIINNILPSSNQVISYKDIYPRNYYKAYDPLSNPNGYTTSNSSLREKELLTRAIDFVKSNIPPDAQLDGNGDGFIDNIIFIVSGQPEAWADLLWPHMASFNLSSPVIINNKSAYRYNFQLDSFMEFKVLAHEMGHTLGLPDLYRYHSDNAIIAENPIGVWDLMAGNSPHINNYCKYRFLGWINEPVEINLNGSYSINSTLALENNLFKINSPLTNQYFMLEYYNYNNRYYESNLRPGLLIYRINDAVIGGNAMGPPDLIYLYRPDGTQTEDGKILDACFGRNYYRTEINDFSNPASLLANNEYGGLNIFNIGDAGGNSMTFDIKLSISKFLPNARIPDFISSYSFTAKWDSIQGAKAYYIDVANDVNFTSYIPGYINKQLPKSVNTEITGLEPGHNYFFRLKGEIESGLTEYSNVVKVVTCPPTPNNLALSVNFKGGFRLVWDNSIGADGYYVDLTKDSNFVNYAGGYSRFKVDGYTVCQFTGLNEGTTYYARVMAYNSSGISSVTAKLILNPGSTGVCPPFALAPTNITPNSAKLSWNNSPKETYLDVSKFENFSSYYYSINNVLLGSGLSEYNLYYLTANTTFYYRLRAGESGSLSETSNIVSFTTPPYNPSNVYVQEIASKGFRVFWSVPQYGAAGYQVDIAEDRNFLNRLSGFKNIDVGNINNYYVNNIDLSTNKYVRIRAYNSAGYSGYSEIYEIVKVLSAEQNAIPNKYSLEQNYPNPFNPSTTIKFSIPSVETPYMASQRVILKIYDLLGREIKTLVDKEMSPGNYTITWNADDNYGKKVSTGIYLYSLNAGNFQQTRKMILMK